MESKIDKTFTSEPWRILLIDDDEDDYLLTRSLLEDIRNGQFQLDWVDHFDVGLEACIESAYDAYLIDYQLGERDGLELVRAAIAHNCRKPIILLTGQGNYQVDIEAMRIGVTDYLVKGEVDSQLLERSLRYAIENKQGEEALPKAHE